MKFYTNVYFKVQTEIFKRIVYRNEREDLQYL